MRLKILGCILGLAAFAMAVDKRAVSGAAKPIGPARYPARYGMSM